MKSWNLLCALMAVGLLGCGVGETTDEINAEDTESEGEALTTSLYYPTFDTFINQAAPTTSYESAAYISVVGGTSKRIAYLSFSFTPPKGKVAQSAELLLTGYPGFTSAVGGTIRKFNPSPVPGGWWNRTPDYTWNSPILGTDGSGDLSSIGAVAAGGKYKFTNLKSTIPTQTSTGALQSSSVTYVIRSNSSDDVGYYSSAGTNTALKPALKVVWATNTDWAITSFTATASPTTVTINYAVKNAGEIAAPSVPIRFYANYQTSLTSGSLLCSDTVPALAAGASHPSTGTKRLVCTIPANVVGPVVTAWVDANNAVAEPDEANNKKELPVVVGPDLLPVGPATFATGLNKVTITSPGVKNFGPKAAGASRLGFYLQPTLGSTTRLLCDTAIPSLAPGAKYPSSGNIVMTCSTSAVPAGSYWLLSVADHTKLVTEGRESNTSAVLSSNTILAIGGVGGGADLFVSSIKSTPGNGVLNVTYTVQNRGTQKVNVSTRARFQLAPLFYMPPMVATDYVLATVTIPALSAGQSYSGSFTGQVPAWTPGWYNFYAIADFDKVVTEVNENDIGFFTYGTTNTIMGVPVGSLIQLTPFTATKSGTSVTLSLKAKAIGTAAFSGGTMNFTFSGQTLCSAAIPAISIGATSATITKTCTIPSGATGWISGVVNGSTAGSVYLP